MSYQVLPGISQADLPEWLEAARAKYGLYENRGVNYKDADLAPIVMCTVVCGDEILLVKRGYGLADAEGYWSTVNGFIDEIRPISEIAQQELREELSLDIPLASIRIAKSYTLKNPKEARAYIVFACLVTLAEKPEAIVLDRENTDYKWIKRSQLESYDTLDDLPYSVDTALALR